MYRYNICFLSDGNRVLLLNRLKSPLMGLWNGVGGKIEDGETVEASMYREILEEVGCSPETLTYKGIVSWTVNGEKTGGMYLYTGELPNGKLSDTPILTDEGILDWKSIDWIIDENNQGVVQHVRHYLKNIFMDNRLYEHQVVFESGTLIHYQRQPLKETVLP